MMETTGTGELIAAVDLGSNSFHMVIAREYQGEFRTLERRGHKVQLAAGLDENNILSEEAQQRGLDCLREFSQHLQGIEPYKVSVLATNALRVARNRKQFTERAAAILGYPVEVISGREEARLIYLGVSHTLPKAAGKRLVIDIGGGSTEFIIGTGSEPSMLESMHMGCVSFTRRFFANGEINEKNFANAIDAARQELMSIEASYKKMGWDQAVGSSGTIRAVEQALVGNGWETEGITSLGLKKLRKQLLQFERIDDIAIPNIKPERRQVFVGGVAILTAAFEALGIERMVYSDGALREGVLWDLLGNAAEVDVRARTLQAMTERFYLDAVQAERVRSTALAMYEQANRDWKLPKRWGMWLQWAAQLHEVGLSISHSGFHKHGGYIVENADMLGFTQSGQATLAALIRHHRRKIPTDAFAMFDGQQQNLMKLCLILRVAVALHHGRGAHPVPDPLLIQSGDAMHWRFPEGWLEEHPLTARDLEQEIQYQKQVGMTLLVS